MRPVLVIAGNGLRRMVRDRANLFFVFVLPLLIILLIGISFGGDVLPRLAVHTPESDVTASSIAEHLERAEGIEIVAYASAHDVEEAVGRGWAGAGVIVPEELDGALARGEEAELVFLTRPGTDGPVLQATVAAAIGEENLVIRAARFLRDQGIGEAQEAEAQAQLAAAMVEGVTVSSRQVGQQDPTAAEFAAVGRFDIGASGQLVLFVFLTALAGSAALIQSRQLGVTRRVLSTPTSPAQTLVGEALGRWAVGVVQGVYIIAGTAVLFSVGWGDPLGVVVLLAVFSAVAAGAAMLLGAVLDNDEQAGGLGIVLGIILAAIGGCMVPMEFLSPTMRTVALATPHGWAVDGYAELVRRGGGIVEIAPNLAVLTAYATVLLTIGTWGLRRTLR